MVGKGGWQRKKHLHCSSCPKRNWILSGTMCFFITIRKIVAKKVFQIDGSVLRMDKRVIFMFDKYPAKLALWWLF